MYDGKCWQIFLSIWLLRIVVFRYHILVAKLFPVGTFHWVLSISEFLCISFFLGVQMERTIYMYTPCSFTQMQLHTSGHLAVCSYSSNLCRLVHSLGLHLSLWIFMFVFLFSAIAELLDNAVDEVIISVGWNLGEFILNILCIEWMKLLTVSYTTLVFILEWSNWLKVS